MPEMNLKQITDKLNSEFTGDVRKLVFWYDSNAEFNDDVDSLGLENAKVLRLEPYNQFYTKYFLEYEDRDTNYLLYAPFEKPNIRENHLADILHYSKEFFADRASLLAIDLGIDENNKSVIQHYIKFFANKDRLQKFYDLEIGNYTKSSIEIALMGVLCKNKTSSFEEVLRTVLTEDGFEDNKYLIEFEKYDLLKSFWGYVSQVFGYDDLSPTLEKLMIAMFVTYTAKDVQTEIPKAWQPYVSNKSGTIVAFLDNLMNSYIYGERYDEIADKIFQIINGSNYFAEMEIENLISCGIFEGIDKLLVDWMVERLEHEDIGVKLGGRNIAELCAERRKKHHGKKFKKEYFVLENAYYLISDSKYRPISGIKNIVEFYCKEKFKIDRRYRYFYYHLDRIEDTSHFERLRELVENIYTNEHLNRMMVNWNSEFISAGEDTGLEHQKDFFNNHVNRAKDKIVVIISDAFRYEVAHSLFEKMQEDEKCSVTITAMQGVLPSYTPLGMASLLPHKKLEYNDKYEVLVDDKTCATTEQREKILKEYKSNSRCISFDSMKNMKRDELRSIFNGQDVVYVYHNQIDTRGDKASTENEVFTACEEAVEEIHSLVRRLSSQANTHHFFVTADHGFVYKRDKIQANDKITTDIRNASIGQRYVIAPEALSVDGVNSISLGKILGNDDARTISYPIASDIFKVPGAGQNFVHGGCSPQEMIVPLVEVKVERGKKETSTAQLALISLTNKITNLITTLDFVQSYPISDLVKETTYRVYFISENNEKISNVHIVNADKKEQDTSQRIFRLRFSFKNQKYERTQKYYLVAFDERNDMELFRHEIVMDIAFSDDFGFFG